MEPLKPKAKTLREWIQEAADIWNTGDYEKDEQFRNQKLVRVEDAQQELQEWKDKSYDLNSYACELEARLAEARQLLLGKAPNFYYIEKKLGCGTEKARVEWVKRASKLFEELRGILGPEERVICVDR